MSKCKTRDDLQRLLNHERGKMSPIPQPLAPSLPSLASTITNKCCYLINKCHKGNSILSLLDNVTIEFKSSRKNHQTINQLWRAPQRKSSILQFSPLILQLSLTMVVCTLIASAASISREGNEISVVANQETLASSNSVKQPPVAQKRLGGLDPSDYVDEVGEMDIMAGQQQIPTAQLMSAAGHLVPENFFLPGGSIPSIHPAVATRYATLHHLQQQQLHQQQLMAAAAAVSASQQQQQQQQQQQSQVQQSQQQQQSQLSQQQSSQQDPMQQVASHVHARHVLAPPPAQPGAAVVSPASSAQTSALAAAKYQQLLMATSAAGQLDPQEAQQLIDYNGYNMATQPDPRDAAVQMDLAEYLASGSQQPVVPMFEQQPVVRHQHHDRQLAQQQQQQQHQQQLVAAASRDKEREQMIAAATEQQIVTELAVLQHQREQLYHQQREQHQELLNAQASEGSAAEGSGGGGGGYGMIGVAATGGANIGPEYQIESGSGAYEQSPKEQQQQQQQHNHNHHQHQHQSSGSQKPFGLPTRSSNKEPHGILKPLGNPQTISSPVIDFVTNQLPKTSQAEKLAEKLPQPQTPTVFSFSSNKDPMDKVKAVNQKKRTVMKQAEQMLRLTIKSINEKFGTNLGDQTDIPFLLSSIGPLGFLQNVLFDPTLLVTLLNQAEKTYQSDVLPGPVKQIVRPVLNIFRVPNKKRDKANLLNIVSYLVSNGQTGTPTKHRQGTGIEKHGNKNTKSFR